MRKSRWSISIILLVLASAMASAQSSAPATTPAGQSAASASAANPSGVSEFEVNGLKVIVKERRGSQTMVAGLFFRGGAANITADNAGIESLVLNTAVEASERFPRAQLRSELSRMAASLSSGVNRDYSVLTLACTRSNFDRSWQIFTDVALHPLFAQEDFDLTQRKLIVAQNQNIDSPDTYLQDLQSSAAYAGHPYANDSEGTPESLAKLTVADARAYHKKMMQTSRLLLVMVGDFDPAQLRVRIAASFGTLPRGAAAPAPENPLVFTAPRVTVTPRSLATNYIQGVFAGPQYRSQDYDALRVAMDILRDRVYTVVRIQHNLSYAPNAFLDTADASTGGIYVTAVDADQAVSLMLKEMTTLKKEPVDADTLTAIVSQTLTSYYMSNQTNASQAGVLARYELIGGGWRNAETLLDRVRAVTPADVQRVAKQYMHDLQFVVLGNESSIHKQTFTAQP